MVKLPRAEAEHLAAELVEQLLPHIQRALADLLSEPDPDDLSTAPRKCMTTPNFGSLDI